MTTKKDGSFKDKAEAGVKQELSQVQPTENNILAALSYVWLLCLIPLLFARKDQYVQHHARQGAVLLVFELIFGWFPIFGLIFALISIVGIVKALQGKKWDMPVVKLILDKFVLNQK